MRKRIPLYEVTRELAAVAMGRRPATLVIRDGRWVNVCSGEIIDHTDIAVYAGRIAYCGPDASPLIGEETTVVEAAGRYLVPGLLDAHMHVESSMLTVTQFTRAVLPHGTTGAFIDPHEIANVLGLPGVKLMADEARTVPLAIYVQVPSCVPAAPGFETTGGKIGPTEVEEALTWPNVIGLGEVMNYTGVAAGDEKLHAEIAATLRAGKTVGGHYASPELGAGFHAYAAAGPSDDHEGRTAADAIARVRQGMIAFLRQGSAWHDLVAQLSAVTESGIDPHRVALCTDDRHPGTLVTDGHMDDVVRLAIKSGLPPITAIQMATLNTAEHFKVSHDVGCIAPGRFADIIITSDLKSLPIELVLADGAVVAADGKLTVEITPPAYPPEARDSVHLARSLTPADFEVDAPIDSGTVAARAIGVVENQVITNARTVELPVEDGKVRLPADGDLAFLAVVERHHRSGRIGHGFVSGFGLSPHCALASTVSHDSHNLLIMGTDPNAMAQAGNRVAEMGGGVCLVRGNEVLAEIPLPIAGLMSAAPAEEVAAQAERLHRGLEECGCRLNNAFMTFSLLALPVIPELRLTDRGLVDTKAEKFVPLFLT